MFIIKSFIQQNRDKNAKKRLQIPLFGYNK